MGLKVTNNAFGALNAGISNSDTIIVLQAGQGARFPSLSAGDYFYATLIDTSNNLEIVKVTARATDTLTVVRAQDGTTARAYNVNDRFELRPTAALFNEKADAADVTASLATKVNKAGDTMTGDLGVGATPLARMHATKAGAEVARFTNSQSNGGDWEFKIGGGGFEDRKLMIADKFGGADNVRISVDSVGRVTMPYQPAFQVVGAVTATYGPGAQIPFTDSVVANAVFNTGGHWSNANDRFTAPVTGKYLFYVAIYYQNGASTFGSIAPRVNGSQITAGDTFILFDGGSSNLGSADNQIKGTFVFDLSANDYVDIAVRAGSNALNIYSGHSFFGGHLIG